MDFRTQHQHPFSAAEASQLDVSTIVAEIARLQNSITHLESSQAELASFLAEEQDADLQQAWQENEGVMAAQRERVELLRAVLVDKVGVESLAHYGVEAPSGIAGTAGAPVPAAEGGQPAEPSTATATATAPTPASAPTTAAEDHAATTRRLNGSTANGTGGTAPVPAPAPDVLMDEDGDGLHL